MEGSDSHAVRVVVLSQEEARTPTARAIYPLKHIYQYCLLPALAAVQYYALSNRVHPRSLLVIFTIHGDTFPEQQQYVVTIKEKTCIYKLLNQLFALVSCSKIFYTLKLFLRLLKH
jgi:hypothetical protein